MSPVMDCSQALVLLHDLVAGDLPASRQQALEGHFEACADCAGERDLMFRIESCWSRFEGPEPPSNLWDRISARLEAPVPELVPEPSMLDRLGRWLVEGLFPQGRLRALAIPAVAGVTLGLVAWYGPLSGPATLAPGEHGAVLSRLEPYLDREFDRIASSYREGLIQSSFEQVSHDYHWTHVGSAFQDYLTRHQLNPEGDARR